MDKVVKGSVQKIWPKPGPSSNLNRRKIFPCRQGYRVDSPLKSARRDRSSAATKKNFHDNFFLLRPMLLFFIVSI